MDKVKISALSSWEEADVAADDLRKEAKKEEYQEEEGQKGVIDDKVVAL